MIKTGGNFNKKDNYIYFLASNVERMTHGAPVHNYLLVAINELNTPIELRHFEGWLNNNKMVFIDSGIFNLVMEHVRNHSNLTMDEGLTLAPDEIDGFENLFDRYVEIVQQYGEQSWGYIELDQGGRDNKIKTRTKLESMGLKPVPVYHPFNDGWDYFDYLAERYDRICFGNVVQASRYERLRLVATAWERHRKYPNLWIHLLGLTPNEWLYALPVNSGDSSAWLSSVRWSGYQERTSGKTIGNLPNNFQYQLSSDPFSNVGSRKATKMAAFGSHIIQKNWHNHLQSLKNLGFEVYPKEKLS